MKKRSGRLAWMRVGADGEGVVANARAELLREPACFTGLIDAWDRVLIATYKASPFPCCRSLNFPTLDH
jgi:hypothetical protein